MPAAQITKVKTLDRLMTTEEAADILCVSYSWLKKAAQRRQVPFTSVGRSVRFTTDQVAEIILAGEHRAIAPHIQPSRGSARSKL